MKLPTIPLPEPVFMIYLPHCEPGRRQSAMLSAARLALWGLPTVAAEMVLAHMRGPRPVWLTLLATYLVLATMVLLVGVCVSDEEAGR